MTWTMAEQEMRSLSSGREYLKERKKKPVGEPMRKNMANKMRVEHEDIMKIIEDHYWRQSNNLNY